MLAAACFMRCQQDDIVYPEMDMNVAATYLNLNELTQPAVVVVEGTEGSHVLKVMSNEKWTLSSSQSWCSISEKEGFKYSQIPVSFSENPWNESRMAELTFLINETQEEKKVIVEQKAAEISLIADVTSLRYSIGGGGKDVVLRTNAEAWQVEIIDESTNLPATWCTVTPVSGRGKDTLSVIAQSNATGVLRKANMVFTAVDMRLTIPIIQAETLEPPAITLEANDAFLLSWDEIIGVDGYTLKIVKDDQSEISINIPSSVITSHNLGAIDWNGYVGMISVQLFSYTNMDGTVIEAGGEIITVHNLFDETSGTGVEDDEYIITKPRHLRNVGKYLDKHYKQTVDIDLTGIDLEPISTELASNVYTGTFVGVYDAAKGTVVDASTKRSSEQYKIKNWTLDKGSNSNCGLFAAIGPTGIVRNVSIESAVITGKAYVGAIAGGCAGQIISCHTIGSGGKISTPETNDAYIYLGGIVGYLSEAGEVSYCSNTAAIEGTAGAVGGVAGMMMRDANNAPAVSYCINKAGVVLSKTTQVGGIVGEIGNITGTVLNKITGCINTGSVSGSAVNNQVGGIVGRAFTDTEVSQSYNTGSITAQGSAGGIVGRMGGANATTATIRDCYNTGTITSMGTAVNGNSNAAGILATSTFPASSGGVLTIENCHNVGNIVTSSGASFGSGLFNRANNATVKITTMKNCFSLNEDSKLQPGESDQYISNASSSYKNLSASEMKDIASFTDWDFSSIWQMGSEYPILQGLSE
jgi:hypothetical protein